MLYGESTAPAPALLSLRQRSDTGWHRFPPQNVDAAGQKAPTSRLQGGREGSNASRGHGERSCRLEAATGDDRPWGCRDKHPQRARPRGRHRQREPRARRWSSAVLLSPRLPSHHGPGLSCRLSCLGRAACRYITTCFLAFHKF